VTTPTTGNPPAGWYTDPADPAGQRWFDGAGWTTHVQAPPPPVAPAPAVPSPYLPAAFPSAPATSPDGASRFGSAGYAPEQSYGFEPAGFPTQQAAAPTTGTGWIQPVENHYLVNPSGDVARGKNTPARVALVVSILAMLGVPIAAIAGICFAVVGLKRATTLESFGQAPKGRTQARWALALSIIGAVLSVFLIVNAVRGYLAENQLTDGPASTSTVDTLAMETEIAAGILTQAGITVTVDCPDQVVTGATSFQCVALDAQAVPTTVQVVVDATGGWTWQVG
jgi:hypothetical protein